MDQKVEGEGQAVVVERKVGEASGEVRKIWEATKMSFSFKACA
jgi:hypothetical protein